MNNDSKWCEVFISRSEYMGNIYSFVNPHDNTICLLSHAAFLPGYGGILYEGIGNWTFNQVKKIVDDEEVIATPLKVRFIKKYIKLKPETNNQERV